MSSTIPPYIPAAHAIQDKIKLNREPSPQSNASAPAVPKEGLPNSQGPTERGSAYFLQKTAAANANAAKSKAAQNSAPVDEITHMTLGKSSEVPSSPGDQEEVEMFQPRFLQAQPGRFPNSAGTKTTKQESGEQINGPVDNDTHQVFGKAPVKFSSQSAAQEFGTFFHRLSKCLPSFSFYPTRIL